MRSSLQFLTVMLTHLSIMKQRSPTWESCPNPLPLCLTFIYVFSEENFSWQKLKTLWRRWFFLKATVAIHVLCVCPTLKEYVAKENWTSASTNFSSIFQPINLSTVRLVILLSIIWFIYSYSHIKLRYNNKHLKSKCLVM